MTPHTFLVGFFVGILASAILCWSKVVERNGGDDGTRTRGLCRDSPAEFFVGPLLLDI